MIFSVIFDKKERLEIEQKFFKIIWAKRADFSGTDLQWLF